MQQLPHLPTAAASLNVRFPHLKISATLDRSMRRCRHCDEMLANRLVMEAELQLRTYKNSITKLENTIKMLQDMIEQDAEGEDDVHTLKSNSLGHAV